jgi:hypothetical protein
MDNPIVASTRHLDAPWIAANLAVLNEAAVDVRLDVDFQVLAAKRTRDQELVWHCRQSYRNAGQELPSAIFAVGGVEPAQFAAVQQSVTPLPGVAFLLMGA